jgi:hypothetical protein
MTNVSRACAIGDITIANIESARNYKIEIEAHENLKLTDAPALKPQKVFEFFTELSEFAFDMLGDVSKIPLAYVIREHEDALPELTEPSFGEANSPFESFNQELVARAPIYVTDAAGARSLCHHYSLDRMTVWKILYQICNGTMYYSYIRQFQASRDGRGAFFALYTALLGSQAAANYASQAENKLQNLYLNGQKAKNWGFKKYVLSHMDQHTTLEKLTEHGHNGIDETSKIRHFSRGITDPELEMVKGSVCANQQLDTFDKVVATYRTYIESKKHHTRDSRISVNVSQIGTTSRHGGGNRTQTTKKTGPEEDSYDASANYLAHKVDTGKYYNTNEWNNSLNKNQRNYLRQNNRSSSKQKSRHSGGGGSSNTSEEKTEALKQMQKKQKVMEATIASLQASQALNEVESNKMDIVSDEDTIPKKGKSTKKKTLQLQRKKR